MSLEDFFIPDKPRIRKRGMGAWYAVAKIKKLGETRLRILSILDESNRWLSNSKITSLYYEKAKKEHFRPVRKGTISGRLSEMLALGLVRMVSNPAVLTDPDQTHIWDYEDLPVWRITEKGKQALEEAARHDSR